jgi:prepilin signal peptidase PulO-like enzyme (type II secretory pathway)
MAGMAAVFFLYGASGLVVPTWALTGLIFVWLLLFVTACRWWTPHPRRVLLLPVVALVVLFAVVAAGAAWLGWSA